MDSITIRVGDSKAKAIVHGESCDYAATTVYDEYDPNSLFNAIKKSISLAKKDEKTDWPRYGELYYTLDFSKPEFVTTRNWNGRDFECHIKKFGLAFKEKDKAIEAAKKVFKFFDKERK